MVGEAISYAAEFIYSLWVILSLALCGGMFVENPVSERFSKMRYYLGVLGLNRYAYWFGNLLFDMIIYMIWMLFMVGLVVPLKLTAFQADISGYTLLLLSFGFSHMTFSYFISFFFSNP